MPEFIEVKPKGFDCRAIIRLSRIDQVTEKPSKGAIISLSRNNGEAIDLYVEDDFAAIRAAIMEHAFIDYSKFLQRST